MKKGSGKPAHPPTQGAPAPELACRTVGRVVDKRKHDPDVLDDPFWEEEPSDDNHGIPIAVLALMTIGEVFLEAFLVVVFILFMLDEFLNEDIVVLTRDALLITIDF